MAAVVQILSIGAFLLVGLLWPRAAGEGIANRDTLTNLLTGAFLFGLRVAVYALAGLDLWTGAVDLSFIGSPALQLLFAFLLTDFLRYWLHRLHHRVPILWHFHRVHHSSRRLNATSGLRMHLVDFVQLSLVPLLLFGVIFDVSAWDPRVFVALGVIVGLFDAFQHANLAFPLSWAPFKAWDRLFNNPHFHSWHHTRDVETYGDGNYGQALTIWDRMFGSCVSHPDACAVLGLPDEDDLRLNPLDMQLLRRVREDGGAQPAP